VPPFIAGGLDTSLVLLIGLVGGLAMASMAGARRTQSSHTEMWGANDAQPSTTRLSKTTSTGPTASRWSPQRSSERPLASRPGRLRPKDTGSNSTMAAMMFLHAVGYSSFISDHTSMGTGALISTAIIPAAFNGAVNSSDPVLNGPELVFVRLRSGVSSAAGRASLQRIAEAANKVLAADPNPTGNTVTVLGVQRPVQIVNYRSIGSTPAILAVGLAVGAIVALALTLVASVGHRRRDLALLKGLGFTPRLLASVVAWQSTVTAVVGVTVGVPLGIVIGRQPQRP
jgi:hypothetical protein